MGCLQESSPLGPVPAEESFLIDASRIVRRRSIGGRLEVTRIPLVLSFLSTNRSDRYKNVLLYTHGEYLWWPAGPVTSSVDFADADWRCHRRSGDDNVNLRHSTRPSRTRILGAIMSVRLPRPVHKGQCNEKKERKVRRKLPLKYILGRRVAPSPSNLYILSAFLLWAAKNGNKPPSSSKPSST